MQAHIITLVPFLEKENATLVRYTRAIGILSRLVTHQAGSSVRRWELISDYAAKQAAKIQELHDLREDKLIKAQVTHEQARDEDPNYRSTDDVRHELLLQAKAATESQRTLIDVISRDLKERSSAISMATRPMDLYTRKDVSGRRKNQAQSAL